MHIILGAGIAGLSAAFFLKRTGRPFIILEKNSNYGGLARSFDWNGFRCDFAAHRLFTHDQQVLDLLLDMVPMHHHQRRSQIYYQDTWMKDPIDIVDLAHYSPLGETFQLATDYIRRDKNATEDSFKAYVTKNYGEYLYQAFFRPYTERLFSLPGDQIAVEWARRKVRLASPITRFKKATKTKFNSFYYPIHGGYGAIADALYNEIKENIILGAQVTTLERGSNGAVTSVIYTHAGEQKRLTADTVISTLPLSVNARLFAIDPQLDYQKVDAVYLLINKPQLTANHWLYFMDDKSVINRQVEFKQMSDSNTDPNKTVVCAEVTQSVENPIDSTVQDLVRSRLIERKDVLDAKVITEPFSYPRYRKNYPNTIKTLGATFAQANNFHILGRAAEFEHHEVDDLIGAARDLVSQLTQTPVPVSLISSQPTSAALQNTIIKTVSNDPASSPSYPLIWVIVLAMNNYADTDECIASLQKQAYPNFKILLVDNGSTDDTPNKIRSKFPSVTVIENDQNLGVPAGYNVGFRYSLDHGADHVFMINNDTTVDPHMLDYLVTAAEQPNAGVLHPIVYYYAQPEQVWVSGAKYRPFPPAVVFEKRIFDKAYTELSHAISCGLLITKETLNKIGLFDENFRYLWDDLEFSVRVRKSGLRILQVPKAKMWHKISRTTQPGKPSFWQAHGESGMIYYRLHSNQPRLAATLHLGWFALREFVIKGRIQFLAPFLRGVRTGWHKKLLPPQRVTPVVD